ncbi:hypothetical protein Aduo_017646 [Ancylostoma duodenale]
MIRAVYETSPQNNMCGVSFNSFYRHRLRSFSCVNTELYCVISRAVDVTMNVTVVRFDQAEQAEHVIKYIKEEPRVKIEEIDEEDLQIAINNEVEVKEEIVEPHLMPVDQTVQPGKEAVLRFQDGTTEGLPTMDDEMQERQSNNSLFDNDQKETVERPPDPSIKECFIRIIPRKYRRGMQLRPRPPQVQYTYAGAETEKTHKTRGKRRAEDDVPNKKRKKGRNKTKKTCKTKAKADVPDETNKTKKPDETNKTKRKYKTRGRRSAGADTDVPDENSNLASMENLNFTSTGRFVNAPKRYPN